MTAGPDACTHHWVPSEVQVAQRVDKGENEQLNRVFLMDLSLSSPFSSKELELVFQLSCETKPNGPDLIGCIWDT